MSKKGGCLCDCFSNLCDGDTIWILIILVIIVCCFCGNKDNECC